MRLKLIKILFTIVVSFFYTGLFGIQVVKIKSHISNNTTIPGYGFVVYEANKIKYLLTAKHVVIPKCDSCKVNRIIVDDKFLARIENIHTTEDIVLLAIKGNSKAILDYREDLAEPKIGDAVYVSGRYGYEEKSLPGKILNVYNQYLDAELGGLSVGSSGGPLFISSRNIVDKVAGLVIKDDNKNVTAISSQFIKKYLTTHFGQETRKITQNLPLIMVGINGFINSGNKIDYNQIDYYASNSLGYGAYFDLAVVKQFLFSYQYKTQVVSNETMEPYLPNNLYRNSISMHSLLIKPVVYSNVKNTFVYPFLGYSWGKINPEINFSGANDWIKLSEIGHDYSEKTKSLKVGFGVNFAVFRKLMAGMDLEFEKYFNDYASFNLFNPYEPSDTKSQYFTINFKLGYIVNFHKL
ncbi:MAG: hypothetical protein HN778_02350 [Prolixibacteraceae bacterium]|jgi:hypothetical protein|nr:hypothetical protein [Prolixibacteraceae bacterium]MBT6005909.1 hypothetical protein [Prolixibacteraceae bacterium]MBT6762955.1 hypothetical protein [Prolixibacteraceae bacterium]MBT7000228.1 hypothetical protein [Prolixibacteraceae bacterium]MBT7393652.1 hypothetical protein [Prolixibacteraceae bacterium]